MLLGGLSVNLNHLKKCQLQAYHPNSTLHANRHDKKTCKEAIKLHCPTSKDKCLSFDKHLTQSYQIWQNEVQDEKLDTICPIRI